MTDSTSNQSGSVTRRAPCALVLAGVLAGLAANFAAAEPVRVSGDANAFLTVLPVVSGTTLGVFAVPNADTLALSGCGVALNDRDLTAAAQTWVTYGLTAGSVVELDLGDIDLGGTPMIVPQALRDPTNPISGRPLSQFDSNQSLPLEPLVEVDVAPRDLPLVPLPPAAWAGLSTLALGAGVGFIRRRRIARP